MICRHLKWNTRYMIMCSCYKIENDELYYYVDYLRTNMCKTNNYLHQCPIYQGIFDPNRHNCLPALQIKEYFLV